MFVVSLTVFVVSLTTNRSPRLGVRTAGRHTASMQHVGRDWIQRQKLDMTFNVRGPYDSEGALDFRFTEFLIRYRIFITSYSFNDTSPLYLFAVLAEAFHNYA